MRKIRLIFAAAFVLLCTLVGETRFAKATPVLTIGVGDRVYSFSAIEFVDDCGTLRLRCQKEILDGIISNAFVPPVDAKVYFNPRSDKVFSVRKERSGRAVNAKKLYEDVETALSVGGGHVECETIILEPGIKQADAEKDFFERGRFTTVFANSSPERKSNIALSAQSVIGVKVLPGETFSFNDTVGERSEERGYKTAKVIIDKKMTDGTGGGVCQTSSTLYNAVVLSGLAIAERHPHSVAPTYVEKSFDATVAFGALDLKFVNDTDGVIYIGGKVTFSSVCFIVYGRKSDKEYSRETEILETVEEQNEKGETVIKKYVTAGYVVAKKNGKTVSKKRLSKDEYIVNKVVINREKDENDEIGRENGEVSREKPN